MQIRIMESVIGYTCVSLLWILLLCGQPITAYLDLDKCKDTLGMQSGEIPDSAITASSSYMSYDNSVGPTQARIRDESNGGAWCPANKITSDVYEYLEIDLQMLKVITLVETQGRFGNGQGQEYTDQYLLEYQREDGGTWFRFHNARGQEVIPGNANTYTAELREITPPIIARRIRFVPYSNRAKMVCMRVEMYGCDWTDGTVSYSMRQGERRGTEVDLLDFTYDGTIENNHLTGGLGQLTDGEQGQSNFRLDPEGIRIRGYEWIGWRNDTFGNKPVEVIFKFDDVRNFTMMRVYSNNMFNKEVRVFRQALIWFSVGGEYFPGEPVVFQYMRDMLMEYLRPVIIPLKNGIGQYIKMQLFFDAKWMMISEVTFESEYAEGNFTSEVAPDGHTVSPAGGSTTTKDITVIVFPDNKPKSNYSTPRDSRHGNKKDHRGRSDSDIQNNPPALEPSEDDFRTGNGTDELGPTKPQKNLDDEYIGIIIGALAALILLLFAIIIFIIMRHRKNKYNNNHRNMKPIEPRNVTMDLSDIRAASNGKVSNGNMYNFVATSDGESDREDTNPSRDYAVPGDLGIPSTALIMKVPSNHTMTDHPTSPHTGTATLPFQQPPSALTYHQGNNPYRVQPMSTSPLMSGMAGSPYAATDITTPAPVSLPNIQGVSGNNVYAVPGNLDFLWAEELSVMEFPRDKLKFVQKLGEGQFGEVHLCEALGLPELIGDDFLLNRTDSSPFMVAVKTLRHNANEHARADFQKEMKILSRLKDPNIVRVLGVCTRDNPLSVVVEYMRYGDLHQYLQKHTIEGTVTTKRHKAMPQLSYGCLIHIASQIASGMKYLESLNMVHRDLASRNCLVGNLYTIKISDFGMSRSLYSSDYYRIEGKAVLPIRWMAWESVLLGKFSCKSDVWSFGVTLWEVLCFSREQPYNDLTDDQVIENLGRFYRTSDGTIGGEKYLPQPANCPRELYDLMCECWNRDDSLRPAFREVHMFLQRKSVGYNPLEDKQRVGAACHMGTLGTLSKSYTNVV